MNNLEIRESAASDINAIEKIYPAAFPNEVLSPLVLELLNDSAIMTSHVAVLDANVVGHVIFTTCSIADLNVTVSLLGPLAVLPKLHKQGIGSALVHHGLSRLNNTHADLICVLGDPAYYGRFGFQPEHDIKPPFGSLEEWHGAWQSKYIGEHSTRYAGKLLVPTQWDQASLWGP